MTALHHNTTTNRRVHVRNATRKPQQRKSWRSCLDVSTSRVDPGQDPRYSRAWSAREAVGKSQSKHHRAPKAQPMSNTIPREMKVTHVSGAMGCETMAMVVPYARPHTEEVDVLMPQILTQMLERTVETPSHSRMPSSCDPRDGAGDRVRGWPRRGNLAVRR